MWLEWQMKEQGLNLIKPIEMVILGKMDIFSCGEADNSSRDKLCSFFFPNKVLT